MLNILLYHIFMDPSALPMAVLLMLGNLFLAYNFRDKYKTMLAAK
ncbi:MAG: hypothetical protein Q8N05_06565 [Bacteroidota bacterium]|nr:hypothetical protein [Bacteroidota bacterium]